MFGPVGFATYCPVRSEIRWDDHTQFEASGFSRSTISRNEAFHQPLRTVAPRICGSFHCDRPRKQLEGDTLYIHTDSPFSRSIVSLHLNSRLSAVAMKQKISTEMNGCASHLM